MFVPYVLATSLMLIATANTIYLDPSFKAASLSPIEASRILAAVIGPTLGRVIFNLGLLAMALSTISLHMVACGFVCSELFGWKIGDWRYRLAMLLPTGSPYRRTSSADFCCRWHTWRSSGCKSAESTWATIARAACAAPRHWPR